MPDVQDFDHIVSNAIENLIGMPNKKDHPNVRNFRSVSAIRLIA